MRKTMLRKRVKVKFQQKKFVSVTNCCKKERYKAVTSCDHLYYINNNNNTFILMNKSTIVKYAEALDA